MKRPIVMIALALAAACHTDPYGPEHYGPEEPLFPGSEARLTFSREDKYHNPFHADRVSWAQDGSGILYEFGPRIYQPGESTVFSCSSFTVCTRVSRDPLDTCIAMLPPGGGGAFWESCETRKNHTDSTDLLSGAAQSATGLLLYTEMTGQTDLPVPLLHHGELWLADPAHDPVRRKLRTLYPQSYGSGNWLADLQWAGPNTFMARGVLIGHDGRFNTTSVILGTIAGDTAALMPVAGTDGVVAFSPIDDGASVVTVYGNNLVRRVRVSDGVATVLALPEVAGAHTLDVSCSTTACIVLTVSAPGTSWTIWKLELASGTISVARTFGHSITSARLSSRTGRVVTLQNSNVYLLDLVVQ